MAAFWIIIAIVGVVAIVTRLRRQIEDVFDTGAEIITNATKRARAAVLVACGAVAGLRDTGLQAIQPVSGGWVGWRMLGALIYLGVLSLVTLGDLGLLFLTLDAMGLSLRQPPPLLRDADVLLVFSAAGAWIFFGALWLELKSAIPELAFWSNAGQEFRTRLESIARTCFWTLPVVAGILGLWRLDQVGLATFLPAGFTDVLVRFAFVMLAGTTILATALAAWGSVGVLHLAFVLTVTAVWLMLGALQLLLDVLTVIVTSIAKFLKTLIVLVAELGKSVWNWMVRLFGSGLKLNQIDPPIAGGAIGDPSPGAQTSAPSSPASDADGLDQTPNRRRYARVK